jgi:peptidoglycan/LPS O-acetylase OafA/YrhL
MNKSILRGPSIEQRTIDTGGRSTGFDYLRIALASGVIAWHSVGTSYGLPYGYVLMDGPIRPFIAAILPMFFALSGFLVAGSLNRTKAISTFLGLRALRILPALAVEVILSALLLGPLLTSVSLTSYFSSPILASYFLNIFGDIHYQLPGMFLDNPVPDIVNTQLWTVPWELKCYLVLTFLAILSIAKNKTLLFGLVVSGTLALFVRQLLIGHGYFDQEHLVHGPVLVMSFLSAVAIYNYKSIIPWSGRLAALSTACLATCLCVPGGDFFVGFPAAYTAIYIGLLNPRKIALLRGADYSYGLFLYGFAIQQAVAQAGAWTHHWYINLAITMPAASLFAAFSWHLVEKPALRLKSVLPRIEAILANVRLRNRKQTVSQS